MKAGRRALLALLVLVFIAGLLFGFLAAVFGARADVGQSEQASAVIFGTAMITFAVVGIVAANRAVETNDFRIPLLCGVGEVAAFTLLFMFGP